MSNYVTLQVKDEMARLPGVGDMTIFGARDYSMRLWLNPEQLASRNLTVGDVIAAVQEQNVQVAAGIVGGPPLPPGTCRSNTPSTPWGGWPSPRNSREIVVKTGLDGSVTRVKDVARVELGAADYSTSTPLQRPARRGHRRLPVARHQLHRHRKRDLQEVGGAQAKTFPRASITPSPTTRRPSSATASGT